MSASSKISICNGALIKLGDRLINSLDDDTKTARMLNLRWDPCRRAILRAYPWKFATSRVVLSPTSNTPAYDYSYEFQLPADCLRIRLVNEGDEEYRVEGRTILSNNDSLNVKYVRDIDDTSQFDVLFGEALSAYLAWDICYAITQSGELKAQLWKEFESVIARAKHSSATEEPAEELSMDTWLEARYTGTSYGFVRDPMT